MAQEKSSNKDQIIMPQKYLDKIVKTQEDQEKSRQEEYTVLREHLAQMNILLSELIKVGQSGSTVASGKKYIPFHTGSQLAVQLVIPPSIDTPPPNPDSYPTKIDIYSINSNRVVPHMTLINDGPGEIFFIVAYAKNAFNEKEGHLNVNDQRELFNVYEVRLRSTLPKTTFRLIEGIFRTGSFAPNTKANIEIRPTVQPNEILKNFTIEFDLNVPITITVPTVQTFPADPTPLGLSIQPPLTPGATATPVDAATGLPMPFTIPEGFIIELFGIFANMSTDYTIRIYVEFIPGSFTLTSPFPVNNRGLVINQSLNLSFFSSVGFDPFGAPPGGRRVLLTITNDDPFSNMIGDIDALAILRQIS